MYQIVHENKSVANILNSARTLFMKFGIKRVSVEEICEKAEVSKMTFYRNFKNKLEVAIEVFNYSSDYSMKEYTDIMKSDNSFQDKIAKLIHMKEENSTGISEEFIRDIFENNIEELSQLMQNQREKFTKQLRSDFLKAQKRGDLRKDLHIDFIIQRMNQMQVDVLNPELHKIYPNKQKLIMALTNSFFYGIVTPAK